MRRLSTELVMQMLLPLLVVVLLSGYLSYYFAVRYAKASYDRVLYETARGIAQRVRVSGGRAEIDLPRAALMLHDSDETDRLYYQVASRRQGYIAGEYELPGPAFDNDPAPFYYSAELHGETVHGVAIQLGELPDGDTVVVQVAETSRKRDALAEDVMAAIVVPQALIVVLALLAAWSGIKTGLLPLNRLERAVHSRNPTDLSPLPDAEVPAEVRPLTDAINALLRRLDNALGVQQRFVSDAAHQLRTPLAALKLEIERALREDDPRTHREALAQLRQPVDRMARLANQLLTLARAEPGAESPMRFAPVDLRALAFEVGASFVPRALQQGADLGFSGDEQPVMVNGDALLLGELVRNLVDNALAYGRPEGRITVGVEAGAELVLVVEDDGPGIPEEAREKVFERFQRLPGSTGNGAGLGLAIVREIARAHGAGIALGTPPGGGTRVRVSFPPAGQTIGAPPPP